MKITFYQVTEPLQTPEFARTIEDEEGLEIEAFRHGAWVSADDLGEAFFLGRGKIEQLEGDPTA